LTTTLENATKSGTTTSAQVTALQTQLSTLQQQFNSANEALAQSSARETNANKTIQQLRSDLTKQANEGKNF
jgi:predicted  nucleic acid-binding Zn-ribbon protein